MEWPKKCKVEIEIEYDQHKPDWEKRPTKILLNGKESDLNEIRTTILGFQQQVSAGK